MAGATEQIIPIVRSAASVFGRAAQLGHVVRDIHDAMRTWTDIFQVGPFVLVEDVTLEEAIYRGARTDVRMNVALSYLGDMQIELIQPLNDAPSPYRDFLGAGQEGLQHVAFWPPDFEGACRQLAAHGLEPLYSVRQAAQVKPTLYYPDPGGLGAMVELIEATPPKRKIYAALTALAHSWDGTAPVRRVGTFFDVLTIA